MNTIKPGSPQLKNLAVEVRARPDANAQLTNNPLGTIVAVNARVVGELSKVEDAYQKDGVDGALKTLGALGSEGPVSELTVQLALGYLEKYQPALLDLLRVKQGSLSAPDSLVVQRNLRKVVDAAGSLARADEELKKAAVGPDPFGGVVSLDRVGNAYGRADYAELVEQLSSLRGAVNSVTSGLHNAMLTGTPEEATQALYWLARLQAKLPGAGIEIRLPSDITPKRRAMIQSGAIANLKDMHGEGPERFVFALLAAKGAGLTLAELSEPLPVLVRGFRAHSLEGLARNRGYDATSAPVFALQRCLEAYPELKTDELESELRLSAMHLVLDAKLGVAERVSLTAIADGPRASLDALGRGDIDLFNEIAKRPGWRPDPKAASAALGTYLTEVERAWMAGGPAAAAVDPDIVRQSLPGAKGTFPEHAAAIDALKALIERPRA